MMMIPSVLLYDFLHVQCHVFYVQMFTCAPFTPHPTMYDDNSLYYNYVYDDVLCVQKVVQWGVRFTHHVDARCVYFISFVCLKCCITVCMLCNCLLLNVILRKVVL